MVVFGAFDLGAFCFTTNCWFKNRQISLKLQTEKINNRTDNFVHHAVYYSEKKSNIVLCISQRVLQKNYKADRFRHLRGVPEREHASKSPSLIHMLRKRQYMPIDYTRPLYAPFKVGSLISETAGLFQLIHIFRAISHYTRAFFTGKFSFANK